nr:hypothetical protein [Marseillevirus cajuinensis]
MLKKVLEFIHETYPFPPEEIVPNTRLYRTEYCLLKNYTVSHNGKVVCEWREVVSEQTGGTTYNLVGGLCFSDERLVFERIKDSCNSKLVLRLSEMYRALSSVAKQQRDKIKELEEENCRLRFSPGGEGALEAEKHFYSLTGEKSDA